MNFEITFDYILVTAILVLIGLYLRRFEPPIKPQWQSLALMILGSILGHIMLKNIAYGFVIAGFAFYKDAFIEELKLLKGFVKDEIKEKEE